MVVIHPGSRFLRIGRASDVNPITVPNVVARKTKPPVPTTAFVEGISRPRKGKKAAHTSIVPQKDDEYGISLASDDPVGYRPWISR